MTRNLVVVSLVAVLGCGIPTDPIECHTSQQCDLSAGGECVASGNGRRWCRYQDTSCASGLRWSSEAGDGLARVCIGAEMSPDSGSQALDGAPRPDGPETTTADAMEPPDASSDQVDASSLGVDGGAPSDANMSTPSDGMVSQPADAGVQDAPDVPLPDAGAAIDASEIVVVDGGVPPPDAPVVMPPPDAAPLPPDAAPADARPPVLLVMPSQGDCGNVVLGNSSTVNFTVSNTGGLPTDNLSLTITGAQGGDFLTQNDLCNGHPLTGGGTCTLTVQFTPGDVGLRSGTLTISWAVGSMATIPLSGTGIAPGALALMPGSKDFGPTAVTSSTSSMFMVKNTGGDMTGAISIAVKGPGAAEFTVGDDGCSGMTLTGGSVCMLSVAFEPSEAGGKTASLEVTASPGGTTTSSLSGTGTAMLSISKQGNGAGTVTSIPSGIDCGDSCGATFMASPVLLEAAASGDSDFGGWAYPGCDGPSSCSVDLAAASTIVSPTFTLKKYTLEVTKTGSGAVTSTQSGIDCGSTCSAMFDAGTMVSLNHEAAVGWEFAGWSGDCSESGPCTVTMSGMKTVSATFVPSTPILRVSVTGSGTVGTYDGFIACPGTCEHSYGFNAQPTLYAQPAAGWYFYGWALDCSGRTDCTLTMNDAKQVSAEFRIKPITNGQLASVLIGQTNYTAMTANSGGRSAKSLYYPNGLAVSPDGSALWVEDLCNRRVLRFALPIVDPATANLVVGQPDMTGLATSSPSQNILGECYGQAGGGVSIDSSAIWVSDTTNYRMMRWNVNPASDGENANGVLGQPDFTHKYYGLSSYRFGGIPQTTLIGPGGVWHQGNTLIVADRQNSRVMIWRKPITSSEQAADVVLGQPDFLTNTVLNPPTRKSLSYPETVYVDDNGRLYVNDTGNYRILVWNAVPASSYAQADYVIGQQDFVSHGANAGQGFSSCNDHGFNQVSGMLVWNNSLFVSDNGNGRVLVFTPLPTSSYPTANGILGGTSFDVRYGALHTQSGISTPAGLAVSGNILYVADEYDNRVLGFALSQ